MKAVAAFEGSDLGDAGSGEGHNDGDHIDGELELQELGDAVVDVPAPHHGLHDAAEVIVCQDDVRCLLRHIRPCDALQNTACRLAYMNLPLKPSLCLDQGRSMEVQISSEHVFCHLTCGGCELPQHQRDPKV